MAHHGAGLRRLLTMQGMAARDRDALIAALRTDYRTAPLGEPERAMLDYAVKLTRTPAAVTADDVARLRALGLDDRAIHDLCAVAAYYAFVNRIADGLGVELEPHLVP